MRERACKNCHLITKNESICPKCKTHTLSDDYTGEVVLLKPKESSIIQEKFTEKIKKQVIEGYL